VYEEVKKIIRTIDVDHLLLIYKIPEQSKKGVSHLLSIFKTS